MEALSFRKIVLIVMVMITTTMMGNMAKAEEHFVGGGKSSWAPNVNLTEWSIQEQFHVGDWLYFGYDKHMFNVLEVNKTSYENCIDTGFIKNITGGAGRDVYQLEEAKIYYFLSGGGFCWQGMKVAIDVTEDVAPTPQHVPPKTNSASEFYGIHVNQTLVVLILVLTWGILFK